MFLSTIKRRLTTWIAIFAILGGALFPSVGMAINSEHSSQFVMELCSTVEAGRAITIDLNQEQSQMKMEHCPFCLVHAPFVAPTQANLSFENPQVSQFFPQLYYQSPKPLFAWIVQPSRAPPLDI